MARGIIVAGAQSSRIAPPSRDLGPRKGTQRFTLPSKEESSDSYDEDNDSEGPAGIPSGWAQQAAAGVSTMGYDEVEPEVAVGGVVMPRTPGDSQHISDEAFPSGASPSVGGPGGAVTPLPPTGGQ